jgi:hypothetical protein
MQQHAKAALLVQLVTEMELAHADLALFLYRFLPACIANHAVPIVPPVRLYLQIVLHVDLVLML